MIIGPRSPISDPYCVLSKKSRQTGELNFVPRSCEILCASSQRMRTYVELNFVLEVARTKDTVVLNVEEERGMTARRANPSFY